MKNVAALFESNSFLKKYIEDTFLSLQLYYGVSELSEQTKTKVLNICYQYFTDSPIQIGSLEDEKGEPYSIERKLSSIISSIKKPDSDSKPVITGSGALFSRSKPNETEDLIESLQVERKIKKKEMYTHPKGSPMYDLLDNIQKVLKVLANSWYGANSQKGFVFYTPWSGTATTITGQRLVMHAAMTMEAFLGNNIPFLYESSVYNFIKYTVYQERKYNYAEYINDFTDTDKYSPAKLFKIITTKCEFERSREFDEFLLNTLGNLQHEDLVRLYYKNNFYEFLENSSKVCDELLANCFDEEFIDPMHPTDNVKPFISEMYEIIHEYVAYIYIESDISKIFDNLIRKVILVVDTDSTFIYLDPFHKFVTKYFEIDEEEASSIKGRVQICNIATNICAKFTAHIMHKLTENMGVKPHKRKIINMKSEFLFSRMLLTTGKKNYAGNIILQEGNVMDSPDFDMKGLPIKKVGTPKPIRIHFKQILIDDILSPKYIDIYSVISKFERYSFTIKESLLNGETACLKPDKYTSIGSYDKPYRQQPFIGQLIWNHLYKANAFINTFESIYIAKVKDEFNRVFEAEEFIEAFPEEAALLQELFNSDELLNEQGLRVVALPKYVKQMPDWLIAILDVDSMVTDRMQPAMPLLGALNVYCANYKAKSHMTNIITL